MIAINSTGYPCLAVIQHFNIAKPAQSHVYSCGRRLLEKWLEGDMDGIQSMPDFEDVTIMGLEAASQLWDNYYRAAKEHKWGPFANVN